jgi:V/A-type H+-transporting ATPase subunit D
MKFTKNELRNQQHRLTQLQRYLPTLQLKKAMLQLEVQEALIEIQSAKTAFQKSYTFVSGFSSLFLTQMGVDLKDALKVIEVKKHYENIAGVEVPYFDDIIFEKIEYNLFSTPPWLDAAIDGLQALTEAQVKIAIAEEKKNALEEELRQVSIRVNLFEKILIPRALKNIKKIKVFLGDQQLAAVSRAKVAKGKIEAKKA